ncbi:MAG: hypothetical protein ACI8ZB_005122 [Desulforhopalus sp.]|jgi:hypothetical protein
MFLTRNTHSGQLDMYHFDPVFEEEVILACSKFLPFLVDQFITLDMFPPPLYLYPKRNPPEPRRLRRKTALVISYSSSRKG